MQEDISHRSVALSIKSAKMTARVLAKAIVQALRHMNSKLHKAPASPKRDTSPKIYKGKQSLKQLSQNGGGLQNLEITDKNIKFFEPVARKYDVDYALHRDKSENPPRWLVFFKAKDADMLTLAFKEFSKKTLSKEQEKPSKFRHLKKEHEAQYKPKHINMYHATKRIKLKQPKSQKSRDNGQYKPKHINMRRVTRKINLAKNQRKFEKEQATPKLLDMRQATKKIKIRERGGRDR